MSTKYTSDELAKFPRVLPDKPEGWTRKMLVHFSLDGGGSATYAIADAAGTVMPFVYAYNTADKPPWKGYLLNDSVRESMSWPELVKAWPAWLAEREAKAAHGAEGQAG